MVAPAGPAPSEREASPAGERRTFKSNEAMPFVKRLLRNASIVTGELAIEWFHKFQGQINHRLQAFYNSREVIEDPKLIQIYVEKTEPHQFVTPTPSVFLEIKNNMESWEQGIYRLTANLLLGCSNSGSLINVSVKVNDHEVFGVPMAIRVPSEDMRIPIQLSRHLLLTEGENVIQILVSRSDSMMRSPVVTSYFGSLELVRGG